MPRSRGHPRKHQVGTLRIRSLSVCLPRLENAFCLRYRDRDGSYMALDDGTYFKLEPVKSPISSPSQSVQSPVSSPSRSVKSTVIASPPSWKHCDELPPVEVSYQDLMKSGSSEKSPLTPFQESSKNPIDEDPEPIDLFYEEELKAEPEVEYVKTETPVTATKRKEPTPDVEIVGCSREADDVTSHEPLRKRPKESELGEERLSTLLSTFDAKSAQVSSLLVDMNNNLSQAKAELKRKDEKNEKNLQIQDGLRGQLSVKTKEIEDLQEENSRLDTVCKEHEKERQRLESLVEELRNEITRLISGRAGKERNVTELREKMNLLKNAREREVQKVSEELEAQDREIKLLQELNHELSTKSHDAKFCEKMRNGKEKELRELHETVARLTLENSTTVAKYKADYEKKVKKNKEKVANYKKSFENVLNKTKDNFEAEIEQYKKELRVKERLLKECEVLAERESERLESLRSSISPEREKIEGMSRELEMKKNEIISHAVAEERAKLTAHRKMCSKYHQVDAAKSNKDWEQKVLVARQESKAEFDLRIREIQDEYDHVLESCRAELEVKRREVELFSSDADKEALTTFTFGCMQLNTSSSFVEGDDFPDSVLLAYSNLRGKIRDHGKVLHKRHGMSAFHSEQSPEPLLHLNKVCGVYPRTEWEAYLESGILSHPISYPPYSRNPQNARPVSARLQDLETQNQVSTEFQPYMEVALRQFNKADSPERKKPKFDVFFASSPVWETYSQTDRSEVPKRFLHIHGITGIQK